MRNAVILLAMCLISPLLPSGTAFAGSQKPCEFPRDCDYDPTTSRCEPGLENADYSRNYSGKICSCDKKIHKCRIVFFEPVQCKSDDDCWVSETPFSHAIKRPQAKRGKRFRGCKDGELEPKCIANLCDLRGLRC